MLKHILYFELKKRFANRSFYIVSFSLVILIVLSLLNGNNWYEYRKENIQKIREKQNEQHTTYLKDARLELNKNQDTVNLFSPLNPVVSYGGKRVYGYVTPDPISILNIGQSDLYPYYTLFTGIEKKYLLFESEIQNPLNLFIGKMDLSFLIIYVLPLFIIAISFNIISEEKESGTIRLLKTQNISFARYIFIKLLFRYLWINLLVAGTVLILALLIETGIMYSGKPLFLYLIIILFYTFFWFVLCYFVNSFGRSSLLNGIFMLSFWILFLFLIPTLLNQIATTKYGIPSRELATVKAREKNSSIDREALLKKYIEQNPHHDPEKYKNASMKTIQWYPDFLAWQMEVEKGQERLEENFHKELIRQQQFIERYSFISPGIIVSQVYNDITETGVTNYVSYARDLRTFSHSYKDFLRDKIFRREPLTLSELKQLPAFIPAEVSHYKSILFKNITIISLLLIILTVAAFMQTGKNSIV